MISQFSINLKCLRKLYSISFRDLEEATNVSRTKLWKIEQGKVSSLQFSDAYAIATYFGLKPENMYFSDFMCEQMSLFSQ